MLDPSRAIFAISVAAELSGTTVQNLRAYERSGLLEPERTEGGTRRYSQRDVDRLLHIRALLDAGLNTAGIEHVLALEAEVARLESGHAVVAISGVRATRRSGHSTGA